MNWEKLENLSQLAAIEEESKTLPVLIFKHSTSCSISGMALNRLQRNWKEADAQMVKPYFLDLLTYREISNAVADHFAVEHESPQVLLIKDGMVIYDTSHMGIDYRAILEKV